MTIFLTRQWGVVRRIVDEQPGLTEIEVDLNGPVAKAYNFPEMTGHVTVNDRVQLNTTAVDLNLGSGGYHFVMHNERVSRPERSAGHMMKLRYTPMQAAVNAAEQASPPELANFDWGASLEGIPVIIASLHSMVAPAAAGFLSARPDAKVAYVMTDGGALPLALSRTVALCRKRGLLIGTVTAGHAFGGDLETVNVYSGLLAARRLLGAEAVVVGMGPGVVGTGTAWGTTAIEVGQIVNAVHSLGGRPVVVPRISFADKRTRHHGLSHHTVTALRFVALTPACLVFPEMEPAARRLVERQLADWHVEEIHTVIWKDGHDGLSLLHRTGIHLESMGRQEHEDPYFFLAPSAAGLAAGELFEKEEQ